MNTEAGGSVSTRQQIVLPEKIYALLRRGTVRAQIDYSLTLFQWQTLDTIAALGGDKRIARFGWCKTQIDQDGDEIQFGCLQAGSAPPCFSLELENPENGRHNGENRACEPDYAPYRMHLYPAAVSHFGGGVRFGDSKGSVKFLVDGTQLTHARVTVKSYEPVAHFTRSLTITDLRPADWLTDERVSAVRLR